MLFLMLTINKLRCTPYPYILLYMLIQILMLLLTKDYLGYTPNSSILYILILIFILILMLYY